MRFSSAHAVTYTEYGVKLHERLLISFERRQQRVELRLDQETLQRHQQWRISTLHNLFRISIVLNCS